MFNKFITTHVKSPEVVRVDVYVPRLDTVEAMRLANDMRAQARRDVAEAYVKQYGCRNTVRVLEVQSEKVFENNSSRARVMFKINDELYDTELFDVDVNGVIVTSRSILEAAVIEQVMTQVIKVLRQKL